MTLDVEGNKLFFLFSHVVKFIDHLTARQLGYQSIQEKILYTLL